MISLDQVLLLQKKVETAVQRIAFLEGQVEQLKSDNDALHSKCAELTKAVAEKTELVSSLEANQGKIEEGILNALTRLDSVENSILNSLDGDSQPEEGGEASEEAAVQDSNPNQDGTSESAGENSDGQQGEASQENAETAAEGEENPAPAEEAQSQAEPLNGQFDIF